MSSRVGMVIGHAIAAVIGFSCGVIAQIVWPTPVFGPRDGAVCYDTARVLEDNKVAKCDRPDQLLLDRPIGYGRVLMTCSCMKKSFDDPKAPTSIELTDEEKKMLEAARDAGELDSPDGGPL